MRHAFVVSKTELMHLIISCYVLLSLTLQDITYGYRQLEGSYRALQQNFLCSCSFVFCMKSSSTRWLIKIIIEVHKWPKYFPVFWTSRKTNASRVCSHRISTYEKINTHTQTIYVEVGNSFIHAARRLNVIQRNNIEDCSGANGCGFVAVSQFFLNEFKIRL